MVLADGDIDEDAHDSKISATRLKLVKQLNLAEFIAHSLRYICEHPMRSNHARVADNEGEARNGFVVVRGKNPAAKGKTGDVLGFVKEDAGSRDGRIYHRKESSINYGKKKIDGAWRTGSYQ